MTGEQALTAVDSSRRSILEHIRSSAEAVSRRELASAFGLHVSTIGAHLRTLEQSQLICRAAIPEARPGRPALRYRAVTTPAAVRTELLEVLVQALGDLPGASELAEQAGWAWSRRGDADGDLQQDVLADLLGVVDRLGFSPQVQASGGGTTLELRSCPVRAIALARPAVVCGLHRGLLRGRLSLHPGQVRGLELVPFARPDVCLVHLRTPALAEQSP